jgi:putative ABC transport system permease protein
VLKHRNPTAAIGGSLAAQDFSRDVYVPISTMRQLVGDFIVQRGSSTFEVEVVELNQITLRIDDIKHVRPTAELIRLTLGLEDEEQPTTKVTADQPVRRGRSDVAMIVPEELLRQARVTRLMFMFFMGLIAAISLLVGGIGIMNIMLATVTERTREIGIRRALGATRQHIVIQFLFETVSLSIVGGLIGVAFGLLGPGLFVLARNSVATLQPGLLAQLPDVVRTVQPIVVPESVVVAFCISVVVGIVFGIYPAVRASVMDPIEALRHE